MCKATLKAMPFQRKERRIKNDEGRKSFEIKDAANYLKRNVLQETFQFLADNILSTQFGILNTSENV